MVFATVIFMVHNFGFCECEVTLWGFLYCLLETLIFDSEEASRSIKTVS